MADDKDDCNCSCHNDEPQGFFEALGQGIEDWRDETVQSITDTLYGKEED